jgi:hypothetical protein
MRRPISRIRSVIETSMIFMIPMPPTIREMAAVAASSHVSVCWASSRVKNRPSATAPSTQSAISTHADWVGATAAGLMPLVDAIRNHVFAAERRHADDTPRCRCWRRTKTRLGRLWTYIRDDRPFAGQALPAAAFFYSPDRRRRASAAASRRLSGPHAGRRLCRICQALRRCSQAAPRKFYELATLRKAPIAPSAVRRIDDVFAIEREINGLARETRLAVRQVRKLAANETEMLASPDQQISSQIPTQDHGNKRARFWRRLQRTGRGRCRAPFLIAHEVTDSGSDRAQLANIRQAGEGGARRRRELKVVADCGVESRHWRSAAFCARTSLEQASTRAEFG